VFLLVRARRRWPLAALVVPGVLVAYGPHLGLVPLTNLRADRYFYLPGLALALGLGAILARLLARLPGVRPGAEADRGPPGGVPRAWIAVTLLASVLGLGTLAQGRIWRDDLRLWTAGVAAAPDSPRAWLGLGDARLRAGRTLEALAAAGRAQALADTAEARELLGVILLAQGDHAGAARALAAALSLPTTQRARILNNLGHAELRLGRPAQALARFEEARRLAPHFDRPWLNEAEALARLGRTSEARARLVELLRRAPGSADAERALDRLAR
jgi:tetratricopeptide (TPR) repeat protein